MVPKRCMHLQQPTNPLVCHLICWLQSPCSMQKHCYSCLLIMPCHYNEMKKTVKHIILAMQVAQRSTRTYGWGQSMWKTLPWLISWCSRTHQLPGGTSAPSPSITWATSRPNSPSSTPATKCPSKPHFQNPLFFFAMKTAWKHLGMLASPLLELKLVVLLCGRFPKDTQPGLVRAEAAVASKKLIALGLQFRPLEKIIRDAVESLKSRGYIS